MMKHYAFYFFVLLILLAQVTPVTAWSTYTHGAIAVECFPDSPEMLDEIVSASCLPDVSTNFFSPSAKDAMYSVLHSAAAEVRARRLLESTDLNRRQRATLLGYLTHYYADPVAHGESGYPNSKIIFTNKTDLNHYAAYLFMDMLLYRRYFRGDRLNPSAYTPDVDTAVVEKLLGEEGEAAGNPALLLQRFRASIAVQKALFEMIISGNPELYEEMNLYFGDCLLGVNGQGGLMDAVAAARESMDNPGQTPPGWKIGDLADDVEDSLVTTGYWVLSRLGKDTGFLRTGKVTHGVFESLINKLFKSRSEKQQAMGKMLSLLLFRRNLTWQQIIDQVDGGTTEKNPAYTKYEKSFHTLRKKEESWLRILPDWGKEERQQCAETFIVLRKQRETELGQVPDSLVKLRQERDDTYRQLQQCRVWNVLDKKRLSSQYQTQSTMTNFLTQYQTTREKARVAGNSQLLTRLDEHAKQFAKSLEREKTEISKQSFLSKVLHPFRAIGLATKRNSLEKTNSVFAQVIEDIKLSICSDDSETTQTQAAASPLVTSDLPLPSNVEEANRMMVRAHVEYMQTMSTPYPLPSLIEEKKNNWLFYVEQYQLLLQNDSE